MWGEAYAILDTDHYLLYIYIYTTTKEPRLGMARKVYRRCIPSVWGKLDNQTNQKAKLHRGASPSWPKWTPSVSCPWPAFYHPRQVFCVCSAYALSLLSGLAVASRLLLAKQNHIQVPFFFPATVSRLYHAQAAALRGWRPAWRCGSARPSPDYQFQPTSLDKTP